MRVAVVAVNHLDKGLVLTPERYESRREADSSAGTPLSRLVQNIRTTVSPPSAGRTTEYVVLDTGDANEGVIHFARKTTPGAALGSTKKVAVPGDVLISRLRPYLKQVALVDDELSPEENIPILCSTEFFVLRSVDDESIAFLVPWLLSAPVQQVLAAAVEGGHHPRVNVSALLSLTVPEEVLSRRRDASTAVEGAVRLYRQARRTLVQETDRATHAGS